MATAVKDYPYLDVNLTWRKNTDPEYPFRAEVAGEQYLIRLNDFPEEHLYTLLVGGVAVADFDEWPANWERREVDEGINPQQAAELRASFATFEDWNDPEMDIYNDYDASKSALDAKG